MARLHRLGRVGRLTRRHLPAALVHQPADEGANGIGQRLLDRHRRDVAASAWPRHRQRHDRRLPAGLLPARRQRDVAGLQRVGVLDHDLTEPCRQHVADSALAAGGQRQMARAVREQLTADVVDLDVGATEAVDGLLRVADDEQLARHGPHGTPVPLMRVVRGQQQQELRPGADRCPGTRRRRYGRTVTAAGRGPLVLLHQRARTVQQVEEVQLAATRLQVLVEIEAAAQLVAQQRREVGVRIALEDVELEHQLLQRLVGCRAREPLGEVGAVSRARRKSRSFDKSISSASAPSRSPASISIGSSSLARRRAPCRDKGSRRLAASRDRGERPDARGQAIDLGRALEFRTRPGGGKVPPLCQLPAGGTQAVHGTVGVHAARRGPGGAPERAAHALGHLLERGLEPRGKRLVVAPPRLIFVSTTNSGSTPAYRILLEQVAQNRGWC